MNTRFAVRAVATLIVFALLVGVGFALYNVGVNVGYNVGIDVANGGQPLPAVPPYAYGPHYQGGFGFFGILLWIIGFFLIIGLLRAAFGWGRWGHGGPGKWSRYAGPGGYYGGEQVAEWHRELHRRGDGGEAGPEGSKPTSGS